MSENPFELILKTLDSFSRCIQTNLSNFLYPVQNQHNLSSKTNPKALPSLSLSSSKDDESSLLQSVDVAFASASLAKVLNFSIPL